jgi:hypothetical protein
MDRLDGNAMAGELRELFGAELTTATGVCGGCRTAELVARLDVYLCAPGVVARCPHCDRALVRIVRDQRGRTWLDLSGLQTLQID